MRVFIFVVLLLAFLCICNSETARKKKKSSDSQRPLNIDPHLYCVACEAIVKEMLKNIRDSKSEVDIYYALSDICTQRNFYVYDYPPPDMKRGCDAFINGNDDRLAEVLRTRENNVDVVDNFCLNITRACKDVVKPSQSPDQ